MNIPPRAVVLAAGRGARLGQLTETVPKALIPLGDSTLIERQLDQLERCGVVDVTVVHGWRGEELVRRLGRVRGRLRVRHERNGQYATTGSAWSLLAAASDLRTAQPVLVTRGDLVLDERILHRVLAAGGSNVAVDSAWRVRTGEEIVATLAQGRLAGVRRAVEQPQGATGQFVGVSLFHPDFARGFIDHCDGLGDRARHADYELPLLGDYARERPCAVTDISGLPWVHVNRPQDLQRVERGRPGAVVHG